jgi:hypothetical protein
MMGRVWLRFGIGEDLVRVLVALSISYSLYVVDGGWGKILVVEELFLRMG